MRVADHQVAGIGVAAQVVEIDAAGIKGTEIGGFRILATFATENIVQGLQLDLTVSVLVNLFLIGFAFRSLRVATATAIPNLFPVLGAEAFLWWSGAGLQLTTVLSLTIAFGIGQTLGPIVTGLITDATGSLSSGLGVSAAALLVGAVAAAFQRPLKASSAASV